MGMTLSERRMDLDRLTQMEIDSIEQEKEQFTVDSPEGASWALRKIRALRKQAAEVQEVATAEINRIHEWSDQETRKLQDNIAYFESLLYGYHLAIMEQDPDRKTIKLPHGTLQMRAQQPVYHRDDTALHEWVAKNKPHYLIPQEAKLDWSSLKKDLIIAGDVLVDPDTGEPVPGIAVEARPPKFSVKVDE